MPLNWSKAFPEGNGPAPQQEQFGSDQLTLGDVYRLFEVSFDRQLKTMDELADEIMRATKQRFAGLEHGGRSDIRHQA